MSDVGKMQKIRNKPKFFSSRTFVALKHLLDHQLSLWHAGIVPAVKLS